MRMCGVAVLGLGMALLAGVLPAAAASAEGSWKTQDGTEITVAKCDADYCGTLTWIVVPKEFQAQCQQMGRDAITAVMRDEKNPDPTLKNRPILGMSMLTLTPAGDPNSYNAVVYNAQDGSTNNAQVFILDGGNTLRIGGGCFGSMCAISQDWPRVPTRDGPPDFTCKP
jgi:uncharacterized protein (DUF2147 family)